MVNTKKIYQKPELNGGLVESLLKEVKELRIEMTPEQREEQRRSFAYGNTAIKHPYITKELVYQIAESMRKGSFI